MVLTGANQVPPAPTAAFGGGTLTLNPNNTIAYDIDFTGLTGAWVGSHIHDGFAGVNGAFLFNLTNSAPGKLSGVVGLFSAFQRAQLRSGALYVNVHSSGFPNGEIRAQITPSFLPVGTGCDTPNAAMLAGGGYTTSGGAIHVDVASALYPGAFGVLFVSPLGKYGTIVFPAPPTPCGLYVDLAYAQPIALPLPGSGSLSLPAVLPPIAGPVAANLQYFGDKGGGHVFASNGLQMLISD